MDCNELEVLDNKFNNILNNETGLKKLDEGLKFLTHFVKRFFSANGEAAGIREMYAIVERNPDKGILCSNVYSIADIYEEYIDGMIAFINDINELNANNEESTEILHKYEDKFNTAKENDEKFIDALFNGVVAKKELMNAEHAIINIEYLIELIGYMETRLEKCRNIINTLLATASEEKTELINACLDLLYTSILRYCHIMIKEIIHTYENIVNLENENPEQVEEKFVLY